MFRTTLALIATAAAIAPATATQSAAPVRVESAVVIERIYTNANGQRKHVLVSPETVRSGDRLVFVLRLRNVGSQPVKGYEAVTPLQAAVQIAPDPAIQLSYDSGRNWSPSGIPLRRLADGRWAPTATLDRPTHARIRFGGTLAPGQSSTVTYRARIL